MTEKNVWQFAGELQKFVFQILKIYKRFSYFDYNSTIRKEIHWIVHLFENKVIWKFLLTSQTEHAN